MQQADLVAVEILRFSRPKELTDSVGTDFFQLTVGEWRCSGVLQPPPTRSPVRARPRSGG